MHDLALNTLSNCNLTFAQFVTPDTSKLHFLPLRWDLHSAFAEYCAQLEATVQVATVFCGQYRYFHSWSESTIPFFLLYALGLECSFPVDNYLHLLSG